MITADDADVQALVEHHEGYRSLPYDDATGKILQKGDTLQGQLTIGIGTNISIGLREEEVRFIFRNRLAEAIRDLYTFPWFATLTHARQVALTDFRYQVGAAGFRGFHATLSALAAQDYEGAAGHLLDSKYARQVPTRATTIAGMLATGADVKVA